MINKFSEEVLQHIFSYLDGNQRLNVCLVCKSWMRAIDCPSLMEDIWVRVGENQRLLELHDTTRKFSCIRFYLIYFDESCINLLNHLGPQLLHLEMCNCHLSTSVKNRYIDKRSKEMHYDLPRIPRVHNCTNLKSLKYCAQIWIMFSSLPSMKSVRFSAINTKSQLTDRSLMALDGIISQNLKELSIPIDVTYDADTYNGIYVTPRSFEEFPSDEVLSFPVIEHFINKRRKTLISMEIQVSPSTNAAVKLTKSLTLHSLTLWSEGFTRVNIIPDFWRSQPQLSELNLRLPDMGDNIINDICKHFPNLQKFDAKLNRCDESVVSLFQLQHLKKINLELCQFINPLAFRRAVAAFKAIDLRFLNLGSTRIETLSLHQLLPCVKQLTYLNLSCCSEVTDLTLVIVSSHLFLLRDLRLRDCIGVTDEGLTGRCEAIPVPLSNLRRLVYLDLAGCDRITEAGVLEVIRFQHLKELYLPNCQSLQDLTDETVKAQNPCLLYINRFTLGI